MASTPKPPDPYKTAGAQEGAEIGAATASGIINNPNEQNIYGSVTNTLAGYEMVQGTDGKWRYVPRYNRTTTLSPDQMKLYGLETQTKANAGQAGVLASANLADLFKTQMSGEGWQPWQMAAAPGEVRQDQAPTDRAAVEEAMLSRYRENTGKQRSAEDAQLAARGLNPGSQGYGQVADTRARADTDAQMQAFLASGDESRAAQNAYNQAALQRYQMGSDWASQANNLRQGQAQEAFALRNQPINEVAALMSGSGVTVPQFSPFSRQGISAAPIGDYINQNYQQQLAASTAFNNGLFGLAGAGLGMFSL